jgi:hypothetical protein
MTMADAMRTPSGAPSQAARDKTGMADGSFPVFDNESAEQAIKLRGHGDKKAVLAHVAKSPVAKNSKKIQDMIDAARERDAGGK